MNLDRDRVVEIQKYGKSAQGRKELIKFLKGGKLTRKQAMLAKCYECSGYYADGKRACTVADCPMIGYMPYK
jgi:hypothetical protein